MLHHLMVFPSFLQQVYRLGSTGPLSRAPGNAHGCCFGTSGASCWQALGALGTEQPGWYYSSLWQYYARYFLPELLAFTGTGAVQSTVGRSSAEWCAGWALSDFHPLFHIEILDVNRMYCLTLSPLARFGKWKMHRHKLTKWMPIALIPSWLNIFLSVEQCLDTGWGRIASLWHKILVLGGIKRRVCVMVRWVLLCFAQSSGRFNHPKCKQALCQDAAGWTPLSWGVLHGSAELAHVLVRPCLVESSHPQNPVTQCRLLSSQVMVPTRSC